MIGTGWRAYPREKVEARDVSRVRNEPNRVGQLVTGPHFQGEICIEEERAGRVKASSAEPAKHTE